MIALNQIQKSIGAVLAWMSEKEYSVYTIKSHSNVLNVFMKFMAKQQLSELNETTALLFIHAKTGITMEGLWGPGNRKLNRYLKPVQNLLRYHETGQFGYYMRSKVPPFLCPQEFENAYLLFQDEYHTRSYADATILSNNATVRKFILYLKENGVRSSKESLVEYLASPEGQCIARHSQKHQELMESYMDREQNSGMSFGSMSL